MIENFESLNLKPELVEALKLQDITEPTTIQEQAIPLILDRKDVIGKSQTGSGKTLAYLLPIISSIEFDSKALQAIILTPTHELALQVERQMDLLTKNSGLLLRTAVIIGSANITRQFEKLKEKPHIVVGSAGRILELIAKKKLSGHTVKTIVVDEADRMIDDKNIDNVKAVIKTTLKDRQILMFSATMPDRARQIAKEIMKEPEFVEAKSKELLPATITNIYFVCEKRDKIDYVRKIIRSEKPEKTIVFINDPNAIETTIEKLEYHKLNATGIYGLADKLERKKAMDDFRSGRKPILVSSDLSSRGLDIEGVTHVISLDIPEEPTFYLHRAGRTGRAGKTGYSISIVTEAEEQWLRKYEKQFDIKIEKRVLSHGKIEEKSIKAHYKKITAGKKIENNKKASMGNKKNDADRKMQYKKSSMKKMNNKNSK